MSLRNPTRWSRATPALACALVLAVLPAACASGQGSRLDDLATGESIAPGGSLTGNYLASRHARAVHDQTAAADFLIRALAKSPDDANLLRRTYLALIVDGRVDEAIPLARKLTEIDQGSTLAHLAVATADLRDGNFEDADRHLSELGGDAVSRLLQPALRGWTLYGLGRYDEALAALQPLAANNRTSALFHLHAGLMEDARGNADAAAGHYEAAADGEMQRSGRFVELVGSFYERTGQPEKARAVYQGYLNENPDTQLLRDALIRLEKGDVPPPEIDTAQEGVAEALFGVSGALSRQNARETSLALARLGLYLRPDFPVLQMLTAQLLETFDRLDSANEVYASISGSSNLSWAARLNIANNLNRLDRFAEAEAVLREMGRDRPDNSEPLIELGDMLRSRERFVDAVAAYDEAVDRVPSLDARHWSLLYARGIALERAKRWDRAEADFLKALEFEPDQPFVLNYLGYSWVEQGLNLDRALEMIERAVELRPNDGYIVDSLGWVHYRLGNYEDAVRELERAVELRPEDPIINDHLGDAYWAVGRQREARFQWEAALHLDPDPELRAEIEQKLERGPHKEASAGAR